MFKTDNTHTKSFLLLSTLLLALWFVNVSLGSVYIPVKSLFSIFFGEESVKESWRIIVMNYRVPKAITAVLVGSGLSVSGLLMQTLFRNPLAGPFVLGISSGASLGVAFLILGASFFGGFLLDFSANSWVLALAASAGAFLVLSAVIIAAARVRNTMSILIIGLMFGSITTAVISVLSYFSEAAQIQQFLFWSFGNLGNLSWNELSVFFVVYFVAMSGLLTLIKPLNSYLLGEDYARSLGVNVQRTSMLILTITSLLAGVITAFVGPIAFIGLAVPHITKLIFTTSSHKVLLPAVALLGAVVLLICDTIAQLPLSELTLPINAITSLFGAPVVVWLLVRKKKIYV